MSDTYERKCCYCGRRFLTERHAEKHQAGVEHFDPRTQQWRVYCQAGHFTADVIGRVTAIRGTP